MTDEERRKETRRKAEMMRNLSPDERNELIAATDNCIDARHRFASANVVHLMPSDGDAA